MFIAYAKKLCPFLLLTSAAFGQNLYHYENLVLSPKGTPLAGASIYVCSGQVKPDFANIPPCTLATIYSNRNGTSQITQPVLTSPLGNYEFFLAGGTYTVARTSPGIQLADLLTIPTLPITGSDLNSTLSGGNDETTNLTTLNITNPGTFTNTAMNEFLTANLNSLNLGALVAGQYAGNFMTEGLSGACNVPSSIAGTPTLQCNGIAGYAVTNNTQGPFSGVNAVGVFGIGKTGVSSARAWGANFLVTSTPGQTNQELNGLEMDVNVTNTSDFGQALNCNGAWTATPTAMGCINVTKPSGGRWTYGLDFSVGATAAADGRAAALIFQPTGTGVNQPSQGTLLVSNDPSSGTHVANQFLDANGNLVSNLPSESFYYTPTGLFQMPPNRISGLPAASGHPGAMVYVNDSTTITTEGQTCTHAESSPTNALAWSNGIVWKCF